MEEEERSHGHVSIDEVDLKLLLVRVDAQVEKSGRVGAGKHSKFKLHSTQHPESHFPLVENPNQINY